ncbi:c-type cytochrome [Cyclonatronum proteinivorum]|nr:cytochrome c [Cyclonatronum proteinivorum]
MISISKGKYLLMLFIAVLVLASCQGMPSEKTQIQPQQNMYWQQKFKAFEPNDFFEDRRAMRVPVEGTIARGHLRQDLAMYQGVNADGSQVDFIPVEITRELLNRGRAQYEITCSPCHGISGLGNGLVIERGYVPPPSFHEDRLLEMVDGGIYSAIYNGAGSMPTFRRIVPRAEDRWAIVAYIRALQISQAATEEEVNSIGLTAGDFGLYDPTSDLATQN